MSVTLSIDFDAPPDRVREFLRDPTNRPLWQSSLRAVADLDGDGGLGTTWRDVTWPGLHPRMTVTEDSETRWAEAGTWHAVTATLILRFVPSAPGTTVLVEASLALPRPLRPLRPLLDVLTLAGIRSDLRRAARLLG